jgi:hypothetical protein
MKTLLTLLLLMVPLVNYAETPVVNGYSNYHGYNTSEGCYGTGCLPTAALIEVMKQPSYYTPEYLQREKLIHAIEDSNEIAKEEMTLNAENNDEQ